MHRWIFRFLSIDDSWWISDWTRSGRLISSRLWICSNKLFRCRWRVCICRLIYRCGSSLWSGDCSSRSRCSCNRGCSTGVGDVANVVRDVEAKALDGVGRPLLGDEVPDPEIPEIPEEVDAAKPVALLGTPLLTAVVAGPEEVVEAPGSPLLAVEVVEALLDTEAVVVALERLLLGDKLIATVAEAELVAILETFKIRPLVVEVVEIFKALEIRPLVGKLVVILETLEIKPLTVVVTTTVAVALVTVVLSVTVTTEQGGHEPEASPKNSSAQVHSKKPAHIL